MKLDELACPNCGASLDGDFLPNQQITCQSCNSVFVASEIEAATTVICPDCRTVNPIEERFCSHCGNELKIFCVLCHTENVVGTVFCTHCGAHLANARARRKKMQEDRRRLRIERMRIIKEKEARQQAEKLQNLLDALDEPENHDFAIYQINQLGPQAVQALIETMRHDDDVDARYGSARALGQICLAHNIKGLDRAKIRKALIEMLADPEVAVRYWAANALGKCQGQAAIEPLGKLLRDNHDGVRSQAEQALERIGGARAEEILAQHEKKGLFNWIKGK
ncbi:MAG: hypothetical protein D6768_09185 [Chloroflexi bacterium]|nr:MAG: hypothetical protein D6768_09185 [Chloroflexota bacterium]